MRIVRLILSLVFCAVVVVYVNRPTDPRTLQESRFQSRHGGDTSLGPLEQIMAMTVAFRQSLIGLGPEDTDAPANGMPQVRASGPNIMKAATMTDPMAAAAEMAGVEERIRNSPMGRMVDSMTTKQVRVQTGARFVKAPD